MTRKHAGYSLLELVLVICIVAFVGALLMSRLEILQARAERATVEHVIGSLRSALALEVARQLAAGRVSELRQWRDTNPMERLAEPPASYIGSLHDSSRAAALEPGVWYFDQGLRTLEYRVRHTSFFESSLPGIPRVRLKIEAEFDDFNGNGEFDTETDEIRGLVVRPLEPYRWIDGRAKEV